MSKSNRKHSVYTKNDAKQTITRKRVSESYTLTPRMISSSTETISNRHKQVIKKANEHKVKLSSLLANSSVNNQQQKEETKTKEQASWRKSLQRYIEVYNAAEAEQRFDLYDVVHDEQHVERMIVRLDRIKERELLRGALSQGCETKGEIIRVHQANQEVTVLLKLHIKKKIVQRDMHYVEERYEFERLWFGEQEGVFQLLRVEPLIYERRPKYGDYVQQYGLEEVGEIEEPLARSVPYLNGAIFTATLPLYHRAAYLRDHAVAYADRWWNEGNPKYELFDVNCTHYVSQCLFAGGAPMNYTGKRSNGWWYTGRVNKQEKWSYSWAVSHALTIYLSSKRHTGLRAIMMDRADQLMLGDVITYDWSGDGRFQHSTIVTAFDAFGQPLVNANTVASRHRYWDYSDSYAWTRNTKYRFFHIVSD
ncbi:amidase domain-containing protein [Paenibacillus yanchengensis]|uniref:Amidase domain-containing protein n=1 Tax=Paenibacillus yanchengensis TaxID=2035833 RepID=A0ABW4YIS0_9BACL